MLDLRFCHYPTKYTTTGILNSSSYGWSEGSITIPQSIQLPEDVCGTGNSVTVTHV